MKRYISAILIPCLLLQLYGCYSFNESTLEELLIKREGTITTKDKSIYFLKQRVNESDVLDNPDIYFSDDWIHSRNGEMIIINTKKANEKSNGIWLIEMDTIKISYKDINTITAETVDAGKTVSAVISILAVIGGIFFFIGIESFGS